MFTISFLPYHSIFLGILLPTQMTWSILGSALILFFTYYQVQVAVAVNNWYRPFYDAIQNALSDSSTTTASDLYGYILSFLILAMTYVLISIMTSFFLLAICV